MEQKPFDFKGLSKESFDNWKKFFRDNFVFTKVINQNEVSDPIVEAIKDKEIPIVSADEISSPIVDALYKVQESVELKETSFPETIKVGIEGVSVIAIKGDPGEPGYTPKKGIDYFDGDDGYTPKKFKDYFTKEEIEKIIKQIEKKIRVPKDGKDGISPIADIDYPSHNQIKKQLEELVALVPKPKDGFTPKHEWNTNNQIRFENPDGTWGEWSKSLELKNNGGGYSFSGYTNFLELHDTPTTYVGQALKVARVNAAENAIEFATPSAAGVSGTINELAYFDSASSIASLAVATYPSLAELAHVKGITSAVQSQIDSKLSLSGGTMTGGLVLVAGTTTVQPIKMVAGTNLTTPVAGVFEFDGIDLFFSV